MASESKVIFWVSCGVCLPLRFVSGFLGVGWWVPYCCACAHGFLVNKKYKCDFHVFFIFYFFKINMTFKIIILLKFDSNLP
jgi:hypothetical protein